MLYIALLMIKNVNVCAAHVNRRSGYLVSQTRKKIIKYDTNKVTVIHMEHIDGEDVGFIYFYPPPYHHHCFSFSSGSY